MPMTKSSPSLSLTLLVVDEEMREALVELGKEVALVALGVCKASFVKKGEDNNGDGDDDDDGNIDDDEDDILFSRRRKVEVRAFARMCLGSSVGVETEKSSLAE